MANQHFPGYTPHYNMLRQKALTALQKEFQERYDEIFAALEVEFPWPMPGFVRRPRPHRNRAEAAAEPKAPAGGKVSARR